MSARETGSKVAGGNAARGNVAGSQGRALRGHTPAPVALWVVPVPDMAGVGRHVRDAARAGIAGWRLVTLCPEGPLAARLREQGSPVIAVEFGPEAGARRSVGALRRAMRLLRPAIVHSHLAYADVIAASVVPGSGARLVTTEHGIAGDDSLYHRNRLGSRAKRTLHALRLRRTDAAIAVSASTAELMREKWAATLPITVVRNGVDRPPATSRQPGLRILSAARLAPEKNIAALLDAFALVHGAHDDARLTVAGEGPEEARLRARADSLGLGGAVSFPGFVDAERAYREHDVVAQLSDWENLSYTLLDATVAGLGVVVTRVGGNPEIVGPESLVTSGEPAAVAQALAEQGLRPDQRPAARGYDRRVATVEEMTAGIAAVYARVLGTAGQVPVAADTRSGADTRSDAVAVPGQVA